MVLPKKKMFLHFNWPIFAQASVAQQFLFCFGSFSKVSFTFSLPFFPCHALRAIVLFLSIWLCVWLSFFLPRSATKHGFIYVAAFCFDYEIGKIEAHTTKQTVVEHIVWHLYFFHWTITNVVFASSMNQINEWKTQTALNPEFHVRKENASC